jgi:hypothetical protein
MEKKFEVEKNQEAGDWQPIDLNIIYGAELAQILAAVEENN